jgi:hypothetical protein
MQMTTSVDPARIRAGFPLKSARGALATAGFGRELRIRRATASCVGELARGRSFAEAGFTALEATIMLVLLFMITMIVTALLLKRSREPGTVAPSSLRAEGVPAGLRWEA